MIRPVSRYDREVPLSDMVATGPVVYATGGRDTVDPDAHSRPRSSPAEVAYRIIREEGGRLEDVQLRLRHANLATTDRVYSHLRAR